MAFAGRQFQSLRRSFRRSKRKRTYDLNETVNGVSKKRRSEGDENVELQFYTSEDYELQKKIDLEIKMREGTKKLLAACNRELQLLEASKALLVSNARVLAYMSELQERKTAQYLEKKGSSAASHGSERSGSTQNGSECGSRPACKGKVAVSDIRIPLFWKDVDHIKNRGDHHRYAVFCLLKIGSDINSTQLVTNVDRTATDVNFEDSFIFENVSPDFQFTIEVYSYNLHDDMTIASTPQKLRRKINSFSNSVGKTVGRRLQASMSAGSNEESLNPSEMPGTPRFHLVACSNLTVNDVNPVTKTHDLSLETDDNARPHCLPLFGNVCCRLAAQPNCMAQSLSQGILHLQERQAGLPSWRRNLWGVLQDGHLKLWDKAEEVSISAVPILTVPVSKDTVVSLSSECSVTYPHVLAVGERESEERHHLATESKGELERWCSALEQLVVDQGAWLNACHTSIGILPSEHRRPSVESDRTGSLYDEMSISADLPSQDESDDENVFVDSPATNLRPRPQLTKVKPFKKPIFTIPKILVRRETNV
ncbi:rhotekin-like isoform X2 [Patiria miniata]|uniref:Rhotekin n=1 Tax=Patiria miniata TaxID=46514 RepID=A0A914ANJ3_PATMI|nr:rhotekin-like isoform X2 [Patiria miniata]